MVLTAQPALSIIILNWNSLQYLRDCVSSIKKQTVGLSYEILVVDGASFDGCAEFLAREHSDVRFFQLQENVGFARANNHAARHARADVLLFLNPDTVILDNAIGKLYHFLVTHPEVGVVGAKLLNSDGTVQTSCIQSFPTLLNQLLDCDLLRKLFPNSSLWGTSPLVNGKTEPQQVHVISGACLLLRKAAFDHVNGFCEDYFMYSEDVHLSYAVTLSGRKNYFVPTAQIIHHGGGSSGQSFSRFATVTMRDSRWKLFRTIRGLTYAECYRMLTVAAALMRVGFSSVLWLVYSPFGLGQRWRLAVQKWVSILSWSLNPHLKNPAK